MTQSLEVPHTYSDWLKCLHKLSCEKLPDGYLEGLSGSTCSGFETVSSKFCNRMTEAVNSMFTQHAKYATKEINHCLEEGDYTLLEIIVKRSMSEMNRCFFFNNVTFLPSDYRFALSKELFREMNRYWSEVLSFLQKIVEESHSQELLDEVYYLKRRIKRVGKASG